MNRVMMARSVEMAAGDVQEKVQDIGKACKAKSVGVLVDAALISEDFKDWARETSAAVRMQLDEGRFAVSDAIDDADYAMFNDNQGARKATAITVTAGMVVTVVLLACMRLRHKRVA